MRGMLIGNIRGEGVTKGTTENRNIVIYKQNADINGAYINR